MITAETYKGRRLRVRTTRAGMTETYVSGVILGSVIGRSDAVQAREMVSLRAWVDAADARRLVEPDAYPAHWYVGAPGRLPG